MARWAGGSEWEGLEELCRLWGGVGGAGQELGGEHGGKGLGVVRLDGACTGKRVHHCSSHAWC